MRGLVHLEEYTVDHTASGRVQQPALGPNIPPLVSEADELLVGIVCVLFGMLTYR
jgi:hypothetical protein